MESDNKGKYQGKAQKISTKYKFSKFETYTNAELLALIRELVNELKANEKTIEANELLIQRKDDELQRLKKKIDLFYNHSYSETKYAGYDSDWLYIDKICFVN
jgi:hypothetical protein